VGRLWPALEWTGTLGAAAIWATQPASAGVWLAAGLWAAGWAARWARLGTLTRRTAGDWPLALFLASACLAAWVAPQRGPALGRLGLLLGAAGLYHTLANSAARERRTFGRALGVAAGLGALYFASQHDWRADPAELEAVGALGQWLSRLAPDLGPRWAPPWPNVVAGTLVVCLPLTAAPLAGALAGSIRRGRGDRALLAASTGLIVFGLVMTESLSAALAVAGATSVGGWWWVARRVTGARQDARALFWGGLALAAALGILATAISPERVAAAFGTLPGLGGPVGRAALYGQVWRLAQDTPYTGAGLAAFAGYYSTYSLGIPFFFLAHAHNAYLNVLLEQGWLGLASFLSLLAAGLWAATQAWQSADAEQRLWALAGGLGTVAAALHGLGDGTLVASPAALVLLAPAGIAAWPQAPWAEGGWRRKADRGLAWGAAAIGAALLIGAALAWRGWLAAWHANWGTVRFAQAQLAAFPTGQWSTGEEIPALEASRPLFERALALNPGNTTAHYRLGLLAGLERDFDRAAAHLAVANAADPGHRGIQKALAYAYAWSGQLERAAPILATLPEARRELSAYAWWWDDQGRGDLAERAKVALAAIEGGE
jgi:hypothetical protein